MKRINFNLSDELLFAIESYAKKMNVNRSAAISFLLSNGLMQEEAIKNLGQFVELAKQEKKPIELANKG